MLACAVKIQLAFRIADNNRLICTRAGRQALRILAALQQLLNCCRLRLRTSHQRSSNCPRRKVAVKNQHNVDCAILHRLLLRPVIICRITDTSAIRLNAARNYRRHRQLLILQSFNRHIFHACRRRHPAHLLRIERQTLRNQLHMVYIIICQHLAGHTCPLLRIIIIDSSEIFMIAAII